MPDIERQLLTELIETADLRLVEKLLPKRPPEPFHFSIGLWTEAAADPVSVVHAQHPEYSTRRFQELANKLRLKLLRRERKSMLSVEYSEAHLIWSMDIFEQVHRGVRFHMLQVIDLGCRMKLKPAVKPGAFTGEEVAEHLNYLKHKHEVPLFLKRDNGSNLNSNKVFSIKKMFAVTPFNSPPGFPQFNGVMERSQGKIKRYLRAIQKDREELDSFAVMVHLSVERANQSLRLMQFAAVTKKPDIFFAFQITLYGDYPGVRVRVFPQSLLPGKCLQNPFRQTLDFQINTFLFPPDEVQKLLFPAFPCALPCQHCTSALIGSFDRQMYHVSQFDL